MRAAAALTAEAARAPAQEMRSTRGGSLDLWKEEERYGFFSAQHGLERFRRLAYAQPA